MNNAPLASPRGDAKNLLAFFLAALTLSLFVSVLPYFSLSYKVAAPIHVTIRTPKDASAVAAAVAALHRPDVIVTTVHVGNPGLWTFLSTTLTMTVSSMILFAIILVIYKAYCRKLGVDPIL